MFALGRFRDRRTAGMRLLSIDEVRQAHRDNCSDDDSEHSARYSPASEAARRAGAQRWDVVPYEQEVVNSIPAAPSEGVVATGVRHSCQRSAVRAAC
jgi:hypothetical protein